MHVCCVFRFVILLKSSVILLIPGVPADFIQQSLTYLDGDIQAQYLEALNTKKDKETEKLDLLFIDGRLQDWLHPTA